VQILLACPKVLTSALKM